MDELIRREDAQRITGELLSGWLTDEERRILESVEADLGELPSVGKAANTITIELSPEQIKKYVENAIVGIVPSEQQWVPCSERLPDERDGKYLVSINGNVFYSTFGAKVWGYPWYIVDTESWAEDVDAWMPLPEPYREGTES